MYLFENILKKETKSYQKSKRNYLSLACMKRCELSSWNHLRCGIIIWAFVGLDALMDSWGADEETVRITSSDMTILVVLASLLQSLRSSKTSNPVKRGNILRIESTLNLTRSQKLLFRIYEPFFQINSDMLIFHFLISSIC